MWLFERTGVNYRYQIRVVPDVTNMVTLLVQVGIAESNADANRLLKANSVDMRDAFLHTWWEKVNAKTPLPMGVPILIRKGKRTYGIPIFMIPIEGQTEKFWQRFYDEEWNGEITWRITLRFYWTQFLRWVQGLRRLSLRILDSSTQSS